MQSIHIYTGWIYIRFTENRYRSHIRCFSVGILVCIMQRQVKTGTSLLVIDSSNTMSLRYYSTGTKYFWMYSRLMLNISTCVLGLSQSVLSLFPFALQDSMAMTGGTAAALPMSNHTRERVTVAKLTLENFYSTLLTQHEERETRCVSPIGHPCMWQPGVPNICIWQRKLVWATF